ncbi:hypothetical protein FP435_04200 [Lactobacillus sp. PV037]|uniref:hypothetical protein n=1 Tax=Lactobacillus sp. PV037 TaxID=2594496 RepID=UPI002240984D|nr:hypothetical protein [Lactobacillus sp. PV037]QNQ83699.1 hypothetical protein FP435_04200 [Lactobacillus sp. PV037]
MKNKNLALTNGIVGLAGGIVLLFGVWFMVAGAMVDVGNNSDSAITFSIITILLYIIKIAILVLGIVGAIYYKGTEQVKTSSNVLLIVGGAISLIPALGWVGGILAIIGGSIYLANLKNFKREYKNETK